MSVIRPALLMFFIVVAMHCAEAKTMKFTMEHNGGNCVGCEWIQGDGEITESTPSDFEAFLKAQPRFGSRMTLLLNSPGGSLTAGIKLGEAIRKARLITDVGESAKLEAGSSTALDREGECSSACAFAYLGGIERWLDESDKLGVHQFYREVAIRNPTAQIFTGLDLSRDQLEAALLVDYVFRMGVDPRLMTLAALTPPTDMHYLSKKEAEELKVVWNPNELEPWAIEPFGNGLVAFSKSKDKKITITAFCRRDKLMRLLVTSEWSEVKYARSTFDQLNGADVFGAKVGRESLSLRIKGSTVMFEIVLPPIKAEALKGMKTSNYEISTLLHAPRSAHESFYWQLPSFGIEKVYALAQRNCI